MQSKILGLLLLICSYSLVLSQTGVPQLKANLVDGDQFNLYDELENGRSVLLDFWWIECFNCGFWIPHMEQLYQDYNQNKEELYVLGLNVIKSPTNDNASITAFKKDNNLNYPEAGWENNTSNGDNKFYNWWYYNIKSITNAGGFGQSILIIPDVNNTPDNEVKWFGVGKMQKAEYNEVRSKLNAENARQIWQTLKPVGVGEKFDAKDIKVFPNPSNGVVNLVIEEAMGQIDVRIIDLSGRLVRSERILGDGNYVLNTSDLKSGLYNLTIITENQTSSKLIQVL